MTSNNSSGHRCPDCGGALECIGEYVEGDTLLTNWHCVACGECWDTGKPVLVDYDPADDLLAKIYAVHGGEADLARAPWSTSEVIAVALAVGRLDLLEAPYTTPDAAWDRLSAHQRRAVAEANPAFAGPDWQGRRCYYA